MKIIALTIAALALTMPGASFAATLLNGAGATFPYPLYSKWAYEYQKKTGVKINYQSIGSGGGIKQITAGTVDFGASDAPLSEKELAEGDLLQFPAAIGGVVPIVNIPGIAAGQLKLTPVVLADIFLGKITKWNDKAITGLNPGVMLPGDGITVVHRSDGSGTTWLFTNYLDKTSKAWHDKPGFGTAIDWPAGVGGKGNEGVATYVKRMSNSIGYVEYVYAMQNKLHHVKMKNRDGVFVDPTMESFSASADKTDWKKTPGFGAILTDMPGKNTWPISGATFILVKKNPKVCANSKDVLAFFDWAYKNGAEMSKALDYVPIPQSVYEIMESAWAASVKCEGKPVWTGK